MTIEIENNHIFLQKVAKVVRSESLVLGSFGPGVRNKKKHVYFFSGTTKAKDGIVGHSGQNEINQGHVWPMMPDWIYLWPIQVRQSQSGPIGSNQGQLGVF